MLAVSVVGDNLSTSHRSSQRSSENRYLVREAEENQKKGTDFADAEPETSTSKGRLEGADLVPACTGKGEARQRSRKPLTPEPSVGNLSHLGPWGILCFASVKFAKGSKEEHLTGEVKCQRARSFEEEGSSLQTRLRGAPSALRTTDFILCTSSVPRFLLSEILAYSLHNGTAK